MKVKSIFVIFSMSLLALLGCIQSKTPTQLEAPESAPRAVIDDTEVVVNATHLRNVKISTNQPSINYSPLVFLNGQYQYAPNYFAPTSSVVTTNAETNLVHKTGDVSSGPHTNLTSIAAPLIRTLMQDNFYGIELSYRDDIYPYWQIYDVSYGNALRFGLDGEQTWTFSLDDWGGGGRTNLMSFVYNNNLYDKTRPYIDFHGTMIRGLKKIMADNGQLYVTAFDDISTSTMTIGGENEATSVSDGQLKLYASETAKLWGLWTDSANESPEPSLFIENNRRIFIFRTTGVDFQNLPPTNLDLRHGTNLSPAELNAATSFVRKTGTVTMMDSLNISNGTLMVTNIVTRSTNAASDARAGASLTLAPEGGSGASGGLGPAVGGTGGDILLSAGIGGAAWNASVQAGTGGAVRIFAGFGGESSSGAGDHDGGDGGALILESGTGGVGYAASIGGHDGRSGGSGGPVSIKAGNGARVSTSSQAFGGDGGTISLEAGNGADGGSGNPSQAGGDGGTITIVSGSGSPSAGGNAGNISVIGGAGGGTVAPSSGGLGASISVVAGNGGDSTISYGTQPAGDGGDLLFSAGRGGTSRTAIGSAAAPAGVGGSITLETGTSGTLPRNYTGTPPAGGDVVVKVSAPGYRPPPVGPPTPYAATGMPGNIYFVFDDMPPATSVRTNAVFGYDSIWLRGPLTGDGSGLTNLIQTRYIEKSDGTVEDSATGLIWDKNASHGSMTWNDAVTYIAGLNASKYKGHNDWRLPSVYKQDGADGPMGLPELDTLGRADGVTANSYTEPTSPFTNIQAQYWSSVTTVSHSDFAWWVGIQSGGIVMNNNKGFSFYVWPVRGGLPITKTDVTIARSDIDMNKHSIINISPNSLLFSDGAHAIKSIGDTISGNLGVSDGNDIYLSEKKSAGFSASWNLSSATEVSVYSNAVSFPFGKYSIVLDSTNQTTAGSISVYFRTFTNGVLLNNTSLTLDARKTNSFEITSGWNEFRIMLSGGGGSIANNGTIYTCVVTRVGGVISSNGTPVYFERDGDSISGNVDVSPSSTVYVTHIEATSGNSTNGVSITGDTGGTTGENGGNVTLSGGNGYNGGAPASGGNIILRGGTKAPYGGVDGAVYIQSPIVATVGSSTELLVQASGVTVTGLTYSDTNLWEDLLFPAASWNPVGAVGAATLAYTHGPSADMGGLAFAQSEDQIAVGKAQLRHDWRTAQPDVYVHIHWMPEVTSTGTVSFELRYTEAGIGGYYYPTRTNTVVTGATNERWRHKMATFPAVHLTNVTTVSHGLSMTICRPDADDGDTFLAPVVVTDIDVHFRVKGSPIPLIMSSP